MDKRKFYKQCGFWPYTTKIVGIWLIIIPFYNLVRGSIVDSNELPYNGWIAGAYYLLFGLVGVFFGLAIYAMFPDIRLSESGIEYRYFWGVFGNAIGWDEITGILDSQIIGGIKGLVIQRSGKSSITWIAWYMHLLHARLVNFSAYPMLLLSNSLSDGNNPLGQIRARIKKKILAN